MPFLHYTLQIGQEKEKGIKEALSLKGMSPISFWITWFLSESVIVLGSVLVSVCGLYAGRILVHTNFGIVFLGFFLFGMSFICLGFLISQLASKGQTLFVVGALMLLVLSGIFYLVQFLMINKGVAKPLVLLTFLLSPVPFGHFLYTMLDGELLTTGWTSDLSPYANDCFIFLVVDAILYFGLSLLIDTVTNNPELKFWKSLPSNTVHVEDENRSGLEMRDVHKTFQVWEKNRYGFSVRKEIQAVNGLNLKVAGHCQTYSLS